MQEGNVISLRENISSDLPIHAQLRRPREPRARDYVEWIVVEDSCNFAQVLSRPHCRTWLVSVSWNLKTDLPMTSASIRK
jgi:hypothetical protein